MKEKKEKSSILIHSDHFKMAQLLPSDNKIEITFIRNRKKEK
jgi:hypothetical protein